MKNLVNYTKWTGFTMSLLLTIGHTTEFLMNNEHTTDKQEFNYFNTTRPVVEMEKRVPIFDTFMVACLLICNVCEFICFLVIFYNMFRQECYFDFDQLTL